VLEPVLEPVERVRLGHSHVAADPDVVVIGSGAGGAPVAWSLARAGLSVAVVEAGTLVTPATTHEALERWYLDQGFLGAADPRGMVLLMAGSAVGGTTPINSGTSLRPLPEQLRAWDSSAGTSFAGGALDPWFAQAEAQCGIHVLPREVQDASAAIVERGFAALGRHDVHILARNAPGCEGSARCCFGCPTGKKLSTDRAFLPEAVDRGARLLVGTRAVAITEDARGVEVLVRGPDGSRRTLRARGVVLAGGALGTPELIRSNRLGDRWALAGDGFKLHPASKLFALMPGPLPHGGVPQGVGYRPPELPNLTMGAGRRHRWWMDRYDRLATFGMMVRDRSTGSVRHPGGRRLVRYALHRDDARDLGAGLLLAAEAMFAAGAERVLLPVCGMDPEVPDVAALRRLRPEQFTPDRLLTCGFHPQGTAGIGRVVDPDLRVAGTRRVWAADASVLPDSPGVNPQVTIMGLSLRLADRLARELA
jgi:choline dehydrogenase-like flavoprotein